MSPLKSAKEEEESSRKLGNEEGRLKNSYQSLWGSLSVVWMSLGSQNPSQPDLNLQKPARYPCWKCYTQPKE